MNILIPVHILLGLMLAGHAQSNKEVEFKKVLRAVVVGFSKQDSASIDKYINKNLGVYQLHRIGVMDRYDHFKSVSFSDGYPTVLFQNAKGVELSPLNYASLPTYNCDSAWSKKGLYVDTNKIDHLLSKICNEWNANEGHNYIPAKTIQFIRDLENKSRRIVLCDNNNREIVFYLSYLKGKWYLTIVDHVSSDCSV